MAANFGGVAIFGTAYTFVTAPAPREQQVNGFFGLNGVERLDGGSRGLQTHVKGLLYGAGVLGYATAENTFMNMQDGVTRPLTDSLGRTWSSCVLDRFTPHGKIRQAPNGYLCREYEAIFFHLPAPTSSSVTMPTQIWLGTGGLPLGPEGPPIDWNDPPGGGS
jgi:hypothetical protein